MKLIGLSQKPSGILRPAPKPKSRNKHIYGIIFE